MYKETDKTENNEIQWITRKSKTFTFLKGKCKIKLSLVPNIFILTMFYSFVCGFPHLQKKYHSGVYNKQGRDNHTYRKQPIKIHILHNFH